MSKIYVVHFNPRATVGLTKCGRRLVDVKNWDDVLERVNCKACLRRAKK